MLLVIGIWIGCAALVETLDHISTGEKWLYRITVWASAAFVIPAVAVAA